MELQAAAMGKGLTLKGNKKTLCVLTYLTPELPMLIPKGFFFLSKTINKQLTCYDY